MEPRTPFPTPTTPRPTRQSNPKSRPPTTHPPSKPHLPLKTKPASATAVVSLPHPLRYKNSKIPVLAHHSTENNHPLASLRRNKRLVHIPYPPQRRCSRRGAGMETHMQVIKSEGTQLEGMRKHLRLCHAWRAHLADEPFLRARN